MNNGISSVSQVMCQITSLFLHFMWERWLRIVEAVLMAVLINGKDGVKLLEDLGGSISGRADQLFSLNT